MGHMMPFIINEFSQIEVISSDGQEKQLVQLSNVTVKKPEVNMGEMAVRGMKLAEVYKLFPMEARNRGLSYCAKVLVDIKHSSFVMKDGQWELKNEPDLTHQFPLFEMPVMLRSSYCWLHKDSSTECWMDQGGYFIIRGNAKVLQPQKVQRNNVHLVKGGKHQQIDVDCRSRRDDEKFRSTSTLYMHLTGSPPIITVDIPFLKAGIPIVGIFKLLGLKSKEDMELLIWGGNADFDEDGIAHRLFSHNLMHPILDNSVEEILDLAGSDVKINDASPEKLRRQVSMQISGELLPHMGYDDSQKTRMKKLAYLAIIARRMLWVYLGRSDPDDRDFEGHKSVQMSAAILSVMFRQQFSSTMRTLRNRFYDRYRKGKHLKVAGIISDSLSREILKAFTDGEVVVSKDASNAGTSVIQMAQQVNPLGIQTHIQRVSTALPRDGKYKQLRGVDPTQLFVFCPTETPEGHGCGLLQNLATFARVRVGAPLKFVEEAVLRLSGKKLKKGKELIRPFKTFADLTPGSKAVFVNSDPIGVTDDEEAFIEVARMARRSKLLPFDCSIVRNKFGVSISSDMGVVVFPLLYLNEIHKLEEAIESARYGTEELWTAMMRLNMIEYVCAHELLEYRVAFSPKEVERAMENGDGFPFSHMAIHPSGFLGTSASSVPWPDHDQAPRVAYQAGMAKQAISTPAANLRDRMDLGYAYELWYPQKPIADTAIARATKMNDWPMGENMIIAIAPYGGWSQEDSIIRNKGSLDRGQGRITVMRIFKAYCRKRGTEQEQFEHPLFKDETTPKCEGIRGGVCYDKLGFDGLPEEGTPVVNGDAIIGRVMHGYQIEMEEDSPLKSIRRDRSIVLQCEPTEVYYVDKVMASITKEGYRSVRIRLRSSRIPQEGDKISSRHGQKGTVGIILNEEDMPYVMSGPNAGMRPDAIINLHSINGRMTIGKLLEMLYSSLGVVKGQFVDATPFRSVSAKWALEELMRCKTANGCYNAEETMIEGFTGKVMSSPWFIAPCFYQTLKHMVLDKITVRQRGQRAVLTRQPLDGRANQGGQRWGEMEKDCLLAHGAAFALDDRLRVASDAHTALICSKCGQIGDSKEETLMQLSTKTAVAEPCRLCKEENSMVMLPTTYCYSQLLIPELATCGVNIVHKFA